jgi:hypothetical protein
MIDDNHQPINHVFLVPSLSPWWCVVYHHGDEGVSLAYERQESEDYHRLATLSFVSTSTDLPDNKHVSLLVEYRSDLLGVKLR